MRLYLQYFSIQFRSAMQYKVSFVLSIIAHMFSSLFSLIAIYFLFDRFGNISGYTFNEILICFSISFMGFSLSEMFFRSFDNFPTIISNGTFDRIMVRPRNIILQVLGNKIEFYKIGRSGISLIILIYAISTYISNITADKIFTVILMIIGTIVIYACLFVIKAAICFFTTQSIEIMNIFTDGARDLAQYPLNIYQKWAVVFFTYILPLAFVNYYPLLYVIGKTNNLLYMLSPIISLLFIIPSYIVWKIGIKKYKSTGS